MNHILRQKEAAFHHSISYRSRYVIGYVYLNNLSTLLDDKPGDMKAGTKIAENIIRDGFYARLIGLAKDDILNFVYPMEGNEQILGINYRDYPNQWGVGWGRS